MDMERINENTIRVSLKNQDLEERGITFIDLLGDHQEIEHLFYSILDEIDIEEQFESPEGVTFQVLPNKDGLELFIIKNDGGDSPLDYLEVPKELSEGNEQLHDFIRRKIDAVVDNEEDELPPKKNIQPTQLVYIFTVPDFERLIDISYTVPTISRDNSLYELDGTYVLELDYRGNSNYQKVKNEVALICEYAEPIPLKEAILKEHGRVIMANRAFQQIREYFPK